MEHVENHSYHRVAIAVDWPRTIIRLWFLCDDLSNLCLMRMADISINLCYDNVNIYSLVPFAATFLRKNQITAAAAAAATVKVVAFLSP